jgi:hypothetical protein
MNDGLDGEIDNLVPNMDNNAPDIQSFSIDLQSGVVGRIYKFKIRAETYAGTVDTNALSVA